MGTSRRIQHFILAVTLPLILVDAAWASPVHVEDEEPAWLVEARESLHRGMDAYYEALFDEALEELSSCTSVLVHGYEKYPVPRDLIRTAVVHLILTLHALGRDEEAEEFARGLAEAGVDDWTEGLDLSPGAMEYLADLEQAMPVPTQGRILVLLPDPACRVFVDGEARDSGQPADVVTGTHWVSILCEDVSSDHHRVEVDDGQVAEVDLTGLELTATAAPEPSDPQDHDLLLEEAVVEKTPWYGDVYNIVLQAAGVLLVATGVGLLAGSLHLKREARTTGSLEYARMEGLSRDLGIAGWTLLGTGALGLIVGVIRAGLMGGQER